MSDFGNALAAARKAAGMTQEQLAAQINVTRQALSHWENGRSQPDEETVQRLSEVLKVSLPQPVIEAPAEADISEAAAEAVPQAQEAEKPYKKWIRLGAAFLAGVAVTLVVALLAQQSGQQVQRTLPMVTAVPSAEEATPEWFQQAASLVPESGRAYVKIQATQDPVRAIRSEDFPNGVGWFYDTSITELAGIDFAITKMTSQYFSGGKIVDTMTYTSENFAEWFGSNVISAKGQIIMGGGMPLQDMDGIGIELYGTDANGNEQAFYGYITLSQEIDE